jgi:cytochrome bd-type quinol oxidase subunit 2
MLQRLKLLILSFSSLILFMAPLSLAGTAYADISQNQINGNLCAGSNGQFDQGVNGTTTNCDTTASTHVNNLIRTIVNILSIIVGVVAVIMIIIAGLRYVTSGGSDEAVKGAKNTILYAIIGLVVVALAQLIVHFVLHSTTTSTT